MKTLRDYIIEGLNEAKKVLAYTNEELLKSTLRLKVVKKLNAYLWLVKMHLMSISKEQKVIETMDQLVRN